MENVRAHVYIKGRVQGVFFRFWAKKIADKLGIYGWVKNLENGQVEAVFEGEKSKVEKIIEACKKGPRHASVANVEVSWDRSEGILDSFDILR